MADEVSNPENQAETTGSGKKKKSINVVIMVLVCRRGAHHSMKKQRGMCVCVCVCQWCLNDLCCVEPECVLLFVVAVLTHIGDKLRLLYYRNYVVAVHHTVLQNTHTHKYLIYLEILHTN